MYLRAEKKDDSDSVTYKLFELYKTKGGDLKKRNVTTDEKGNRITVSKYMESLQTEMTFGIKEFLSDNATTHRKFMMNLFKHKLEGDEFKKVAYDLMIATDKMEQARMICQSKGAFKSSMESEGIPVKDAAFWKYKDIKVCLLYTSPSPRDS